MSFATSQLVHLRETFTPIMAILIDYNLSSTIPEYTVKLLVQLARTGNPIRALFSWPFLQRPNVEENKTECGQCWWSHCYPLVLHGTISAQRFGKGGKKENSSFCTFSMCVCFGGFHILSVPALITKGFLLSLQALIWQNVSGGSAVGYYFQLKCVCSEAIIWLMLLCVYLLAMKPEKRTIDKDF